MAQVLPVITNKDVPNIYRQSSYNYKEPLSYLNKNSINMTRPQLLPVIPSSQKNPSLNNKNLPHEIPSSKRLPQANIYRDYIQDNKSSSYNDKSRNLSETFNDKKLLNIHDYVDLSKISIPENNESLSSNIYTQIYNSGKQGHLLQIVYRPFDVQVNSTGDYEIFQKETDIPLWFEDNVTAVWGISPTFPY